MSVYNVKEITYPNGKKQICIYNDCYIETGNKKQKDNGKNKYIVCDDGTQINASTFAVRSKKEAEKSKNTSMARTVQKVYDYAQSNEWDYFLTITFNKDKIDRYDYEACYYALYKWLKVIKRNSPDCKYLFVPEQHKDGAWHFHGLVANCDLKLTTSPVENIYNISSFKKGFSTATKVKDTKAVSNYISKYITKDLFDCKMKHRYIYSKNFQFLSIQKNT